MSQKLDELLVEPALDGLIIPGNNLEVKACFEDLCIKCGGVSLLDIVRTGSRPLGDDFFIQFCFGKGNEEDHWGRGGEGK